MTAPPPNQPSRTAAPSLVPFVGLVVLTAAELALALAPGDRALRITALVGLLGAKMAVVLTLFMRAQASRRAARLALVALAAAVGFAVVLMLEAAFRVRVS
jgi:hypothetical protein